MKDLVYLQSRTIIDPTTGCWVWQKSTYSGGYGAIGDDGKIKLAHRVAYESLVGPIPSGAHVLHTCDNRLCVNPAHLYTGTNAQNVKDAIDRGRYVGRQLTVEQVLMIRATYPKVSQSALATRLGISQSQVRRIINRTQWKHV
jgi:hypothetical protein